ncbi:transposase family protein [Streptomyces sp. S.PB5]|nr:transposase family protein [Streptomyces sp. S.PB5]MDN3027555.1 transposase family protein [Streptomyces sp. S.PB5]
MRASRPGLTAGRGREPPPPVGLTDRLLVTLVRLRHQLPHAASAEFYGVGRSTVSAAIGEVRPPLAARGFAVPDRSGLRLRTLGTDGGRREAWVGQDPKGHDPKLRPAPRG